MAHRRRLHVLQSSELPGDTMKRTILAAAVAVALIAPTSAQAQMASPVKFGISGGLSIPMSDPAEDEEFSLESNAGYNVAGHLGFQLPMFPLGLRADLGYNGFGGKERSESGDFGTVRAKADMNVLSGTVNAMFQPAGMMMVKPYFIGGIGAYRVKTTVEGSGEFGGETFNEKEDVSKTSFGLNGGLGVRFGLGGMSTFAEARYHYVMNKESCSNESDEVCFPHKTTAFVPISFGIMF
jgi:opacity protein-like surface antigen